MHITFWGLVQYKDIILPVEETPLERMTVVRSAHVHIRVTSTGNMASLYSNEALVYP